jgi:glycosyltransferase involved in cell wall biosynthesis
MMDTLNASSDGTRNLATPCSAQSQVMRAAHAIGFIHSGAFSHVNARLREVLSREFPDACLDSVDTNRLPVWRRYRRPMMALNVMRDYGFKGARDVATVNRYGQRTVEFFEEVRAELSVQLGSRKCDFTIQTQSIVDASQPGIPHFIYTDHTHLANLYYPGFDARRLYSRKWIEKERGIYRHARVIFTPSAFVAKSLIEQYGISESRIQCVGIGGNVPIPPPGSLPEDRYASKEILFVGIEWERKGGPQLVEAFKEVAKDYPDAKLKIIGCSPDVDLRNCTILGRLPLEEVAKHFAAAAIFCMPTRHEPFGVVFLEAFAYRLPVIGSPVGALPEFIENGVNGYLVPLGDVAQMAARLKGLIASPAKCKRFGEAGYLRMRAGYTWEHAGAQIANRIRQELQSLEN